MIDGAEVVMRQRPEVMMAQALRLPDLRPITFAWSNMMYFTLGRNRFARKGALVFGKPYLRITSELPVIPAQPPHPFGRFMLHTQHVLCCNSNMEAIMN